MWAELRKLGVPIGESTVRLFVQELRKRSKPAYVPLDFAPGERAEFDFGEATVKLKGQLVKVPFLAGRLRFSGAMFVECFPTQRQEAFLLGQHHAFEFWRGVPRMVVYDNLKPAVLQVLKGHQRREQDVFLHFHSVYRFEALFANVHAGWEKGPEYQIDEHGNHYYLGYCITLNGVCVYHSGDTSVTKRLVEGVRQFKPHIAILPINGGDYERAERGIAGNMSAREAADFGVAVGADLLIPAHYDMFPNNRDNPAHFVDYLFRMYRAQKFHMMVPGERLIYVK